jgi:hypothetical protein
VKKAYRMKAAVIVCSVLVLSVLGTSIVAQNKKPNEHDKLPQQKAQRKVPRPIVYLGNSDFHGGKIKVSRFDSLMRQGLSAKDSLGNVYKILGFNFEYYERMLYEDSAANSVVMTDLLMEYCIGDTLSRTVAGSIYSHIKPGDTVAIDKVVMTRAARGGIADTIFGKSMTCILVR